MNNLITCLVLVLFLTVLLIIALILIHDFTKEDKNEDK